jgi:MSHA biogenesis protein MshJ
MLPLSASWRRLDHRFLNLKPRERLLIILMTIALLISAVEFLFFSPMRAQLKVERQQQTDSQQRREQLENELAQLQAWQASQEDGSQLIQLEQELAQVDRQIQALSQRMVSPQDMSALLQQLLAREQGMQVVALEKLPLAATGLNSEDKNDAPVLHNGSLLYRHRLRLSLRGNYFDSLRYLQAMEALPWTVYWDSFDYQVEQYPQAILTVEIATLGQEKGWLGG